jgi:hypothetical protein
MSVSLGANGGTYQYPQENDPAGWGDDATDWASAVSAALSNIGLGASVSADAVVNIISTSKGILVPRMTTTQRNAIGSPSTSLLIYNTTTTQYELYTGSTWQSLASYISGTLTVTGAASLQSTLNVTGSSTFANTTVNGTLSVTGGTTLASITGTSAQLNSLSVTGSSSLNTLSVTGNTTLANVTGANITATGTILTANGSVTTPFIAPSGDTNTGLYVISADKIGIAANGARVGEWGAGYGGFIGNIIQVVTTIKTDTFTDSTNNAWTNITGLSVSITPKSTSNKILICAMINSGGGGNNYARGFRLTRSGTAIGVADAGTGTEGTASVMLDYDGGTDTIPITLLDSPSTTSSTTYQIQFFNPPSSTTGFFLNRPRTQDSNSFNGVSTITAMEVYV